jgi:hypothetical protein
VRRAIPRRRHLAEPWYWHAVDRLGRLVREHGMAGLGVVGAGVWAVSLVGVAVTVGGAA